MRARQAVDLSPNGELTRLLHSTSPPKPQLDSLSGAGRVPLHIERG
jgi:hypothetical protein